MTRGSRLGIEALRAAARRVGARVMGAVRPTARSSARPTARGTSGPERTRGNRRASEREGGRLTGSATGRAHGRGPVRRSSTASGPPRNPPLPRNARAGIDLFIEDGAYTTLASAVSILVALTLAFSAATAAWSMSRAGDVQAVADTTAFAGANVVSSYHTAATVVDASILSLGLTGLCVTGAGLAGLLVPGANAAAGEAVRAGVKILKKRNEFTASASKGLQKLEKSIPYLVAANATRVCAAQGSKATGYAGTALAAPRESASDFPAIEGEQIPTDGLEESAGELDGAARELAAAAERTAEAKMRAWIADCGRAGMNMQERAAVLSGLSDALNPDYASSITWNPQVGLDRARAYYQWRRDHDRADGASVEKRADAAARHAFYRFACDKLATAYIEERGGRVTHSVPLLPKNTEEVKATHLYTEVVWPSTQEGDALTLHFGAECPGATGEAGPLLALSAIDTGAARECPECRFSVGDVGKAPAASTSIDNGFEYHLREFTIALDDYVGARNRELELERRAKGSAESAGSSFEDALARLAGKRPRIAPPGRYGCVALVVSGDLDSPEELDTSFNEAAQLSRRGAISAAALAPDPATADNNVLGTFFSSLEERAGPGTIVGLVGDVMDLWGKLLVSYGDLSDGLGRLLDDLMGGFDLLGAGPIARWLGDRVTGAVRALGFEPVDLSQRKPVLTDSSNVVAKSGLTGLADAQEALRSIPLGTTDPHALLQAIGYQAGEYIASMEFTVAEIPLPGGRSIPLTIRLRDLMGSR